MIYIRHIVGSIYVLGILILAITVLYYIFAGILPPVLIEPMAPAVAFLDDWSLKLSYPVAIVVNWVLQFVPFLNQYIPVTNTGILGAQIHWIPLFALFIYTSILKFIDDTVLKARVNEIKKNYEKNQSNKTNSPFNE